MWDLAAHDVAIFNYLLGELPRWASAVGANVLRNRQTDVAFISLGYPGGVIEHIHVSWAEPNKAAGPAPSAMPPRLASTRRRTWAATATAAWL